MSLSDKINPAGSEGIDILFPEDVKEAVNNIKKDFCFGRGEDECKCGNCEKFRKEFGGKLI